MSTWTRLAPGLYENEHGTTIEQDTDGNFEAMGVARGEWVMTSASGRVVFGAYFTLKDAKAAYDEMSR